MWQRGKCATEDRKCFCVNRNLRKQGRRGERRRKQQQQKSQDVCRDKPLVNLISNQINVSVLAVLLREEPKIDIYKYQRERGGDFNLNFDWDFKQMDLFLLYRSFFSYLCCFFLLCSCCSSSFLIIPRYSVIPNPFDLWTKQAKGGLEFHLNSTQQWQNKYHTVSITSDPAAISFRHAGREGKSICGAEEMGKNTTSIVISWMIGLTRQSVLNLDVAACSDVNKSAASAVVDFIKLLPDLISRIPMNRPAEMKQMNNPPPVALQDSIHIDSCLRSAAFN